MLGVSKCLTRAAVQRWRRAANAEQMRWSRCIRWGWNCSEAVQSLEHREALSVMRDRRTTGQ
jgi:hypothetical protein